jgi:endoglucanase
VALCLTPQGYHNVRPDGDIFNNVNLGFWEYILPGYDAFGYIACTGTNFALRANALCHCGWFPTYTITEDYALGMELKRLGYTAVYLKEYLAYGEAPEEMRNIFRQRSRWCKGQMQVFFSNHCPLVNGGLSFGQRLLYTSACWCYITNLVAVPMAVLVPFIAMVFGVLPFVLNRDFALAATLYLISTALINLYCRKRWHIKLMWFGTVSCHLLWFTYTKAIFNVLASKLAIKSKTTFKTTKKKGGPRQRWCLSCFCDRP